MILMRAKSISSAIGRWALKIETFLDPKWQQAKRVPFWASKSRDFQDPPLPTGRVTDLPATKSLSPSAIQKTGTLVILCTGVSVFCILNSVFCILCSVFCILYSVFGIMYFVFCEYVK